MKTKIIYLGLLLVMMSSCALYGKFEKSDYQPEHYNDTIPQWQDIFTDAPLQTLIQAALANNYDLRIAHEHVHQAEATLLGSKLAYLPVIGAGGTPAVQYAPGSDGAYHLSYGFAQASWEIDIFGRLTNQKRMANASLLQSRDFEKAARSELIAAVATTYFRIVELDAQIVAVDTAVVLWQRSLEIMREMKQAGMSDEAAVAQFEAGYYDILAQAKDIRLNLVKAENAMRQLICDDMEVIPRNRLDEIVIREALIDSINLRVTRQRPDVMAAEHNLERMFYNRNYARSSCCPSLSIGGNIGWNGGLIFSAVGNLLQPLFNAGKNITQVRVSKSQLEEAKLNYQNVLLKAATQVHNALASQQTAVAQMPYLVNRVRSMERAYDATQLKMRLGQGTYLEVLISQGDLLEAQINQISAQGRILTTGVDLFLSIGGY